MRSRRFITYLLAPLGLNILLFAAYRVAGVLYPAPELLVAARRGRSLEILLLTLGAFCVPIVYVVARTRLFRRSMNVHEISLLIFVAWLIAESADIFSLLRSGNFPRSFAVFKAAKVAAFAVGALFSTWLLVRKLQGAFLKEHHPLLDRGRFFALFGLAYVSVTSLIVAVHWLQTHNEQGPLVSLAAVIAILVGLNVYGFVVFRLFYKGLQAAATDLYRHPLLVDRNSGLIPEKVSQRLTELEALADSLHSRHLNAASLRSDLKNRLNDLRRLLVIGGRSPHMAWTGGENRVRIIDRTTPRRFLVASPDAASLEVLRTILMAEFDCSVDSFGDGDSAAQAVLGIGYDAIFLDVGLQDPTAFRVTGILREAGIHTPVIAVSAIGPELVADVQAAGMDGFLEKPLDRTELRLRLEQLGAI